MERIFEARLNEIIPTEHPPQPCSVACCDPQNEATLVKRGLIEGPLECPEFLFVCKFGSFHECKPGSECMLDGPCLVSGLTDGLVHEYSDYNKDDFRTWSKPGANEKKGHTVKPQLYSQIENIIETLLYSPVRQRIFQDWEKQEEKRLKKYKDVYVQKCAKRHKPTNLIEMAMMQERHYNACPTNDVLNRDPDRVYAYTKSVADMYEKIQACYKDERICIETVTLGLLYKMQQGVVMDGQVKIPADQFLVENLPLINNLSKFGLDKKKIGRGDKLILANL